MSKAWGGVLLAVLLFVPAMALPSAATVRQEDFEQASEDTSIFPAILAQTVDATERLLAASADPANSTVDPAEQADRVRQILGTFDEELVEAIQARGTTPPRLAELQADYETLSDAARQVIAAQDQLRTNLSEVAETPRDPEAATHLENALSAIALERGGLSDLRSVSGNLSAYGIDPVPLRSAVGDRAQHLDETQRAVQEDLARLRLPALLLLETDRRTVQLGGSLVVSGLALDGGDPATGTTVQVSLGPLERTARVGEDGRYRTGVRIPVSLGPGSYDVETTASINGTDPVAGPIAVDVRPLRAQLVLQPATTVLAERSPLGFSGTVDVGPLDPADRNVTVLVDGRPVANETTDADGAFGGTIEIADWMGGPHDARVRLDATDDRLATAESAPVRIFVPPTADQRTEDETALQGRGDQFIGLGGGTPVFTEFDVPSTGLGPVIDILVGLTLLGLLVLVSHALMTNRGSMSVQAFRDMVGFSPMTRFTRATREDKLAADPRRAFPPSEAELDGRYEAGPLFAAFVDALRAFEDDLPPGITHRELARKLAAEGLEPAELEHAAILYEHVQYVPGADEDAETHLLLQALETVWADYIRQNVEEPPGGRWWPWAPSLNE